MRRNRGAPRTRRRIEQPDPGMVVEIIDAGRVGTPDCEAPFVRRPVEIVDIEAGFRDRMRLPARQIVDPEPGETVLAIDFDRVVLGLAAGFVLLRFRIAPDEAD